LYLTYLKKKTANYRFYSVADLFKIKGYALRQGFWFRALNRVERGILDLTIKCLDKVKSPKLAEILTAIVQKLQQATENMIDRLVRTIGLPLAQKVSNIAVKLGNFGAKHWAQDLLFAAYLAVMEKNR
jgi:hypothetical protein